MEELPQVNPEPEPEPAIAAETVGAPAGEASTQAQASRRHLPAMVAVGAFLLLPVVYLVVRSSGPKTPANSPAGGTASQPSVDIAVLEQAEQAAPTPANKLNLSAAYINAKQANRALPLLTGVLSADPKNATAWNNLCVVHMARQDFAAAVDACTHAVSVAPDFTLAQNNLKWAVGERKRTEEDLATIQQTAASARTKEMDLREGLDDLHLDRYDAAIAAWNRMLELDPHSVVAVNNIGTAYMLKNEYAEAVPWFQKAVAFDSSSQLAKNNLAWANDELAKAKAPE